MTQIFGKQRSSNNLSGDCYILTLIKDWSRYYYHSHNYIVLTDQLHHSLLLSKIFELRSPPLLSDCNKCEVSPKKINKQLSQCLHEPMLPVTLQSPSYSVIQLKSVTKTCVFADHFNQSYFISVTIKNAF